MGKVTVQKYTIENPISMMGEEAGICWNSDVENKDKNYKRGLQCLRDGHMRVAEYVQVYLIIEGYSARVIRELYTHIGGAPTRLQESTRYVDCSNFNYVIPDSIKKNGTALAAYEEFMDVVRIGYEALKEAGVSKEDAANILPLGMETKVVLRTNLRHLIEMSEQRLCNRAYWEFRDLMKEIIEKLSWYSDEWCDLVEFNDVFKPKCEKLGYCPESNGCGYVKKR